MRTGLSRSVTCPDVFIGQFSGRKSRYKMLASTHGPHVPATREGIPSSRAFEDLLRQAPADYFTIGWLLSTLRQRSFGVIILFLGLLETVPVGSTVPSFMLAIMAVQIITRRREPVFPRLITNRGVPTHNLFQLGWRGSPLIRTTY